MGSSGSLRSSEAVPRIGLAKRAAKERKDELTLAQTTKLAQLRRAAIALLLLIGLITSLLWAEKSLISSYRKDSPRRKDSQRRGAEAQGDPSAPKGTFFRDLFGFGARPASPPPRSKANGLLVDFDPDVPLQWEVPGECKASATFSPSRLLYGTVTSHLVTILMPDASRTRSAITFNFLPMSSFSLLFIRNLRLR